MAELSKTREEKYTQVYDGTIFQGQHELDTKNKVTVAIKKSHLSTTLLLLCNY
jgi:hypothetical protein